MHLKTLRNFLLLVLCTIGIGFASAPPAAAQALKITDGSGNPIGSDNSDKLISFGTAKWTEYSTLGCRKQTVKIERTGGLSGAIKVSTEVVAGNDGGNSNILNEFKVHRIASDATSETFIVYYIPDKVTTNNTTTLARIKVSFTCGGQTAFVRFGPSFDGTKNGITPVLEGTDALAGSITGTIALSSTAFDLNAISSDNEWKTNGKLVRELTVTGTNVSGNITLSVSPMGNYGLTVTPTTLPSTGGKVTITYKPSAGNTVNSNPYPKLSVSAAKATTQTVELRTQWDSSTHDPDVTTVPTIPAGTFDPDIYECKTFTGRTTVSLRWELKNPDKIELKSYSQSVINSELDETTKARMIAWNEAYDKYTAMTYTLFRDGKEIVSGLDITSYVDMNVPEGDHKYHVVAHYRNGIRTASSGEKTVKVKRDMAITNYVLEEIYNYPIVNQEEYNNLQDKTKCFKAFGTVTGDDYGINREGFVYKYNFDGKGDPLDPNQDQASGARGDGVRQGVFHNGLWYIAMVSNRKAVAKDASTKANAIGYAAGEYNEEYGHILNINPEGINNNPLKKVANVRTLSNQSLAITDDLSKYYIYFRGYNGNPGDKNANNKISVKDGERYFQTITDLGGCFAFNQTKHWAASGDIKTEAVAHKEIAQYYRTHYMAARGKVEEGTGKLCFAMNMSHDAYIVDLDNSGNPTAYHKITAPSTATTAAGKTVDIIAGTENYIFPVEGEPNKYIHVMRSSGVFLVDVTDINKPNYTLISSDQSEVTSASGLTFTLKNSIDNSTDLFYIHGTSIYSNNSGHFRIDMPQRTMNDGKYTGDISTANFSDMVPMASKLQDAIPGFIAGNSNGMWFGTEDATEDKIAVKYIYQYVPGVRFAKYKFYPVQAFPPARPTIDVVIRHDNPDKDAAPHEADDITHFDIAYSWKRPAKFGTVGDATNFKIDGYNYELLDPNGNVLDNGYVATQDNETDETTYGPFYYNQHQPAAGGKLDFSSYNPETAGEAGIFDVHDGKYTIRVTPVYASTSDTSRKYTGESGLAQDDAKYTPEIYNIRAKLWQASGNSNLYRVDIDFNRAPRTAAEAAGNTVKEGNETDYTYRHGTESNASDYLQPEPASRFKIEVDKGDGRGFQPISNLRIVYDGNILYNPNDAAENAEAKKIEDNFDDHNPGQTIHHGKHDGYVKHDYNFGGYFSSNGRRNVKARAGEGNRGDKMYAQEANHLFYGGNPSESQETQDLVNIEKQKGAFPVVAYHMVDGSKEDIRNLYNWTYRATALYADNQPYESIKGQASVQTTLGLPTTTGVDDVTADAENGGVHIWPVPAESELHISAGEAIETVSIFNISGACVATFEGNNDTAMTVNVDNLASGVYLVKVNANAARRLIKR